MRLRIVILSTFVAFLSLACLTQRVVETVVVTSIVEQVSITEIIKVENEITTTPAATATRESCPAPAPLPSVEAGQWKVALLLEGPVNDLGYNQSAYDGLAAIRINYKAETAYAEYVAPEDMESLLGRYAAEGYNIIIGHGARFSIPANRVAAHYPNTIFIVTDGTADLQRDNTLRLRYEEEQLGFLLGILAGQVTRSDKVAAIGGYEKPPTDYIFDAFRLGVLEVNPTALVSISYIDSLTDSEVMNRAAISLFDHGYDILFPLAGNATAGGLDAAEEAGIGCLGLGNDQSIYAPTNLLTSGIVDYGLSMQIAVDEIVAGSFAPGDYTFSMAEEVLRLAPYNEAKGEISQDVKNSVEEWKAKVISREYEVRVR